MTREDLKSVLSHVKSFYPRFDAVEKDGNRFKILDTVIESWYELIGWMSVEEAMRVLNAHMESERGDKTPTVKLWMQAARRKKASGICTMYFDRKHGIGVWQPEPDGKKYEVKMTWNERKGVFQTPDGYDYVIEGGENEQTQ